MISASIDVNKVDTAHLTPGKKGERFLSLIIRKKKSQWSDGYIAQGVSKENREKGVKGPILGSFKEYEDRKQEEKPKEPAKPLFKDEDDDPFA